MQGLELILTLIEDAVFSERAATDGGHKGLDYIPGATLLGAAAARLYSKLPATATFTLFHSGQVRFGNGLPVGLDLKPAWPVPLCWHYAKSEKILDRGKLIADKVWVGTNLPNNQSSQQLVHGYVTQAGNLLKPREAMRMKTSIDPTTGHTREEVLFGYESLSAGQRFIAYITADTTVANELFDRLRTALASPILLGRSRSAEYGRVAVKIRNFTPPIFTADNQLRITLWLLSDLAVLDNKGQPTLTPRPEWLGLPPGKINLERTFIRTRRYSPWNGYRGGPDMERQVITQGSVLTFDLERPLNTAELVRINSGLGIHKEAGLGQVWLNPTWLGITNEHPKFVSSSTTVEAKDEKKPEFTPALITWLKNEQDRLLSRGALTKQAHDVVTEYRRALASARKLKGLAANTEIGPSASQWGSVLAATKDANSSEALKDKLFKGDSCVCKYTMPGWEDEYWTGQNIKKLADWIRDQFDAHPDVRFMQILAREILDVVKNIPKK